MFTLSNDLTFSNFLDTAEPTNYDMYEPVIVLFESLTFL